MMTSNMQFELTTIIAEEREERGLIGAKQYALGVMIQKRRQELTSILTFLQPWCTPGEDDIRECVRLNAELTLIIIERGA